MHTDDDTMETAAERLRAQDAELQQAHDTSGLAAKVQQDIEFNQSRGDHPPCPRSWADRFGAG